MTFDISPAITSVSTVTPAIEPPQLDRIEEKLDDIIERLERVEELIDEAVNSGAGYNIES